MRQKIIGYAYETSSTAKKLNAPKGCFYVASKKHPMSNETDHVKFDTFTEAMTFAESLPEAFNKYSMANPQEAK